MRFDVFRGIDDYWDQWPLVNDDISEEERLKLYSIPDVDIPPSPPTHSQSIPPSSTTQSSASTGSNHILDILTVPSSLPKLKPTRSPPTKKRKKKKKSISEYRPPSPFSPKPDYRSMDIEQIKKHAMRYGLSTTQSKGRLVKILDEIYNVTHQYETDTDYEFDSEPTTKPLSHTPPTPAVIPENKKARKRPAVHQMSSSDDAEENLPPPTKKPTPMTTSDEDDSDHQGRFLELTVHELSSNTSSSSLSIHGTPPATILSLNNDSPKKPKSNSKAPKKPKLETPTIPLKDLVRNYIESNPQLHARILSYEPIDFEEFHKQMKTDLNMKIVSKELMQCLDDQCITFTLRSRKGAFTSVMRAKRRHK